MNINDILFDSDIITDKILSYLDAKSLAYFGSCCQKWRQLANSESLWHKLCLLKGFQKYDFLLCTDTHPSIPQKTTAASPAFISNESDLSSLCDWRQIYNRSMHLIKNWKSGIYFVAPVIKAHKGRISAFDSNGSVVVTSSSDDQLVKVWSVTEMDCMNSFKIKNDSINCIKIYNEYIITAGEEGIIRIYDIVSGDLEHFLSNSASSGAISKFILAEDKIVAVFNDKTIRVWSLKTFKMVSILRSHTDDIECLTSFKNIIASGSWDKNVCLWDIDTGNKLADLVGHTEVINCLKMKDMNFLISGSGDSTLKIWNLTFGKHKNDRIVLESIDFKNLKGHKSDVYCMDTYSDYIASGGADSMVLVWNFNGDLLYQMSGHLGIVRFIQIDEQKLVSGGDAKRILVWDYKKGKMLNTLHRNPNKINFWYVDETKIITASPEIESNLTLICYW